MVHDDPLPGLDELLEIARTIRRRAENLLPGVAFRRRRRARAAVAALRRAAGNPFIIFVCQGNICRSPFAEALLRARLGDGTFTIASAGVMPRPGRPTPIFGLEAAARHGVDLSGHRSAWLSRQLVDAASLLVIFDEITRSAVFDRYPHPKARVMLLGDLPGLGEIPDPIDGDAAEFGRCYDRICTAIAELVRWLRASAR
jgi:protein-tyrosine-phosphatase